MKVKLNGIERAIIPDLLQESEGDMLQQTIVNELINRIEIKPDEFKKYDIRLEGNMMLWDNKKILAEKEFDFLPPEIQALKDVVDDLSKRRKINQKIYNICKKIKAL